MATATRKTAPAKNGVDPVPSGELWQPLGAAAKIAFIQTHITSVEKTGHNPHHKYNYFQEHGLLDLLRPLLRELHVALVPSPTGKSYTRDGNRAIVSGWLDVIDTDQPPYILRDDGAPYLALDPSGHNVPVDNPLYRVRCYVTNEGVDQQDKATNKALTGWMKYALQKVFAIPTEAVDDADHPDVRQAAQQAGTAKVDPVTAQALVTQVTEFVNDGKLDGNKFKAKLTTYRAKNPAELTAAQFDELSLWVHEQATG